MPFCTYCGQQFTRDEHLERHILTHTNIKPFKCFNCHMSFARRDLLNRHYTVHGRDENQEPLNANGKMPKTAGRTPIACNNCAKTKTKCDKKFPCSRCDARKLKCTARPTRRMTKNLGQPPGSNEDIVSTIEPMPPSSGDASGSGSAMPSESNTSTNSPTMEQSLPALKEGSVWTVATSRGKPKKSDTQRSRQTPAASTTSGNASNPVTFINLTPPMTSFDNNGGRDEQGSHDAMDAVASPQYLLDWSQLQLPMGDEYSQMDNSEMLVDAPMDFAPGMIPAVSSCDSLPGFFGSFSPDAQSLSMPGTSHPVNQLTPPGSNSSTSRQSRSSHGADLRDIKPSYATSDSEEVIQGQGAWSSYRCTPNLPVNACPKTARVNLKRLKETLERPEMWADWAPADDMDFKFSESLEVMQLQERPRDKLLAITQTFLHKVSEIHDDDRGALSDMNNRKDSSNFVLLPPARTLQSLLQAYCNSFELFYPLIPRGIFDPNTLMYQNNDKASSLLVLQMIAQGALSSSSIHGRWLTAGLTETCRISLFDLIEKDIKMSGDPMVLHSALIFTVQAGWSGDKWQMDIAMGQRGMYFAMLRHSGYLDSEAQNLTTANQHSDLDMLWGDWIWHESRSRLSYAWVMVDQELGLFHDTPPLFAVLEFRTPMPDTSALWLAKSAPEWSSVFEKVHEFSNGYSSTGSGARPLSLRDLWRLFLDDEILTQGMQLTPMHMRLLLHPLQSMVCQYRQLLSCFSSTDRFRVRGKAATASSASSTRIRLEEVQTLLQRWYDLADHYLKSSQICPFMQASLILFHLISLNAVTNMPEIERLARREGFDGSYQQLVWTHKQCITDVEEAVFHAGQALRLVREMPKSLRPPWWAGAIYRVALVLWCDSLVQTQATASSSNAAAAPNADSTFTVDALPPDHPLILRYLTKREGVPMLTKSDGVQIPIDDPFAVLFHCIDIVLDGVATRFSDGICSKLSLLAKG